LDLVLFIRMLPFLCVEASRSRIALWRTGDLASRFSEAEGKERRSVLALTDVQVIREPPDGRGPLAARYQIAVRVSSSRCCSLGHVIRPLARYESPYHHRAHRP